MEIKPQICWFLLICFFMIISCSSEKPEPPKPRANVDFQVERLPFYINWSDWYGGFWYIDLYILITEKGGVGARITEIKVEWIVNDSTKSQSLHEGGRVLANGSLRVYIYSTCDRKYRADKIRIRITGRDDNNYTIDKSHEYSITWDTRSVS